MKRFSLRLLLGVALMFGAAAAVRGTMADDRQSDLVRPWPSVLPWTDPDKGLSQEEIRARHQLNRAGYDERFRQWLNDFSMGGQDVRALERLPLNASFLPGPRDLASAVRSADLIVSGMTSDVRFEPGYTVRVTFAIQTILQGAAGQGDQTLVVTMAGGPEPTKDFKGAILTYSEAAPLLLPGEQAVLFLQRQASNGTLVPQDFSGVYRVVAGQVRSTEGNPFSASVDGLSLASFHDRVRQASTQ